MQAIQPKHATPAHPTDDFEFEDLFQHGSLGKSPCFPSSITDDQAFSDTLDSTAHLETVEEDIGGEEEYDDDPEVPVLSVPLSPSMSVGISTTMSMDDFTVLALVGKGGFGKVHQVLHKKTNTIMAMKTLSKKYLISKDAVKDTLMEKNILRRVRHPYVVKLQYAFQSALNVHLVMDFVNGGHLLFHMKRLQVLPEHQARFYIAEIVLALEHLHTLDIVHRDLKPENCLLDAQGHCVLTDFGFARDDVKGLSCSSFCGTLEYMAPEVIKKNKYGKPADWWSLGILLYDMLAGQPPFQHANDHVLQNKILNAPLKMPVFFSAPAKSLVTMLLQRNIEKRLKVADIKAHKFFRNTDWEKMKNREARPPFIPPISKGVYDVGNFDKRLINTKLSESPARSPLSPTQQLWFQGFSYAGSPLIPSVIGGSDGQALLL